MLSCPRKRSGRVFIVSTFDLENVGNYGKRWWKICWTNVGNYLETMLGVSWKLFGNDGNYLKNLFFYSFQRF